MDEETPSRLLLIFVRKPELGRVKTRLARTVGDHRALQIYRKLLDHTRWVAKQVRSDRQVWYAGTPDPSDAWKPPHFSRHRQPEGSLGEKMHSAFDHGFREGYRRIVIVGSDCPSLLPAHVDTAFRHLGDHDVVLGPSEDGGYYLLGLKRSRPELFEGMPWSRPELYSSTLEVIGRNSLRLAELEALNDIDTAGDLNAFRARRWPEIPGL